MTRGKGYARRLLTWMYPTTWKGLSGFMARWIRRKTKHRCNLCFLAGGIADSAHYVACYTPACNAEYCADCIPFLDNICSRCRCQLQKDMEGAEDGYISDDAELLDGESWLRYF